MPGHFPTVRIYQKLPIYRPSGRYVIVVGIFCGGGVVWAGGRFAAPAA
jgi:hypothetical protein